MSELEIGVGVVIGILIIVTFIVSNMTIPPVIPSVPPHPPIEYYQRRHVEWCKLSGVQVSFDTWMSLSDEEKAALIKRGK